MEKYRLKKEYESLFDPDLRSVTGTLSAWAKRLITPNALEKVDNVYITYGHAEKMTNNATITHKSNWSEGKSKFHFTINVNNIAHHEYSDIINAFPELFAKLEETTKKFITEL